MIKKLRLKFVIATMIIVTVILGAVFASIIVVTKNQLAAESAQMLRESLRRAETHSDSQAHAAPPEASVDGATARPDDVRLPFFSVFVDSSGAAELLAGSYRDMFSEIDLNALAAEAIAKSGELGVLEDYALRYFREATDSGCYIAFGDVSIERASLQNLTVTLLQAGLLCLAALLLISILLSRWVARPAERAFAAQKQFVADASHELKTPLTVILSSTELLLGGCRDATERKRLENIQIEGAGMKKLVEELLDSAMLDEEKPGACLAALDFSDIAENCLLTFEPVFFENGQSLEYHIEPSIRIKGDAALLHRLICSLLDNAGKYSGAGGRISLTLEAAQRRARLRVENTGQRIPAAELEKIFERFYRSDRSRASNGSYGLGLAIAKDIASEHKGKLWAENTPNGNAFIFTAALIK